MKKQSLPGVGQRVKEARRTLQLQQQEMAEAMGVSSGHLSEIESGKASPNTDFHIKLSNLYNISVEYIIHGRGDMFYDHGKTKEKPFDFKSDVDTLEKLHWLLENSGYFRTSIMTYASKIIIEEEKVIKQSIKKSKSK